MSDIRVDRGDRSHHSGASSTQIPHGASITVADAHRRRGVAKIEDLDPTSNRAVAEYLSVLDDAAFGGATPVEPKAISPTDPVVSPSPVMNGSNQIDLLLTFAGEKGTIRVS